MANHNHVEVSYNVQTTVDAKYKLIVDFKVTQKPNDLGELDHMALRVKKLFGNKTFKVLAEKCISVQEGKSFIMPGAEKKKGK
jgi:hypothetical protein